MAEKKFRQVVTAEQLEDVTRTQMQTRQGQDMDDDPLMSFTLRMRRSLVSRVDVAAARRPGSVSRNTWIVEAVAEQLAAGGKVAS
jgi:predicted HicB family RNase H-like nuclease